MRVAVLGAGAWGTAISCVLAARLEVALWGRDAAQTATIASTRRNARYLPGFGLPATVKVTADLGDAPRNAHLVLAATPVTRLLTLLGQPCASPPLLWP